MGRGRRREEVGLERVGLRQVGEGEGEEEEEGGASVSG